MALNSKQKAASYDTMKHIEKVRNYINKLISGLMKRQESHDQSKLEAPEVAAFAEWTPKLANATYGTEEYEQFKIELKPALDHHYAHNRHHPEHWPERKDSNADILEEFVSTLDSKNKDLKSTIEILKDYIDVLRSPINNMNILDIGEMFCDWNASSKRQNDGNLRSTIGSNGKRFKISQQLTNIFENSIDILED